MTFLLKSHTEINLGWKDWEKVPRSKSFQKNHLKRWIKFFSKNVQHLILSDFWRWTFLTNHFLVVWTYFWLFRTKNRFFNFFEMQHYYSDILLRGQCWNPDFGLIYYELIMLYRKWFRSTRNWFGTYYCLVRNLLC